MNLTAAHKWVEEPTKVAQMQDNAAWGGTAVRWSVRKVQNSVIPIIRHDNLTPKYSRGGILGFGVKPGEIPTEEQLLLQRRLLHLILPNHLREQEQILQAWIQKCLDEREQLTTLERAKADVRFAHVQQFWRFELLMKILSARKLRIGIKLPKNKAIVAQRLVDHYRLGVKIRVLENEE